MRAILIKEHGGAENLTIADYATPTSKEGFVLVNVKAFGINRAEIYMRKGLWSETTDIIGIEFVGVIKESLSGQFKKGQKVASMVGGLARSINGSYAQYVSLPKANVIPFESNLPWNELAAIPETYATAWGALNWCLEAKENETLLIRGATSTVGLAGLVLAKQIGMRVIATTRSAEKVGLLKEMGAIDVIIDSGQISGDLLAMLPDGVDKVLDLIGNSALADSLLCLHTMGTICIAGFLGGMAPIENYQPVFQIPAGIKLTTLATPLTFGKKGFEYSKIPLQQIITDIEEKRIPNILAKTFNAENIGDAHRLVETDNVNGKVVVEW